ncbi:carboxymethylenebutenolidase [Durotheca rogersii]|uniref:carboxymethylenebutenolidase n=1 Tax=Durotheca rogersii TaxID=419775 RepID=UPI00221F9AF8|nr:carboxymethylenebutenolidase [Durotheca rogersii]KAI5867374.1 carboxymethylenebutenolidase [Durotheca rogersii]
MSIPGAMPADSTAVDSPGARLTDQGSGATIAAPLSRRGRGPGLLLLVDAGLDLGKHEKTLDPPPLHKWAEEGFAVAQLEIASSAGRTSVSADLRAAISALSALPSCDQSERMGIITYMSAVGAAVMEAIESCAEICAVVYYGVSPPSLVSGKLASIAHIAGAGSGDEVSSDGQNVKCYYYAGAGPRFAIPAHDHYRSGSASLAHTRTLSFLKPLVGGPYFDLERIWDEHTYWEFEARSVEETMATMVEEPYVNHVPTLTGGVGRRALTDFYANHFIFSNPPDTELELVSRTVGIDRVVDEFLFKLTHDRVIDWLVPGVPPTGRYIKVPFTSIVNIRGDRLYHEHISWDQATLLRQLGLLPDYLPFPYPVSGEAAASAASWEYRLPVAGVESAEKLASQSSVVSNTMLGYGCRGPNGPSESG